MSPAPKEEPAGVLVIDKPSGPTSHDVVGKLRRALGTRRVGHAGTLDPMASGVLVALVGEATKLSSYLTLHEKKYTARVALGAGTDTLDREGKVVATAPVPAALLAELEALARDPLDLERAPSIAAAIAAELARKEQIPPAFSAIQVGGKRSYDLAREGHAPELAPRPVAVRSLAVAGAGASPEAPWLDIALDVSKGYYVRSLGRDLGEHLQVPAHLAALRRTSSGPFTDAEAKALDAPASDLAAALIALPAAVARALPIAVLTAEGSVRARQGKRLAAEHFTTLPPSPADGDEGASAWLDASGTLVALGGRGPDGELVVRRGFVA